MAKRKPFGISIVLLSTAERKKLATLRKESGNTATPLTAEQRRRLVTRPFGEVVRHEGKSWAGALIPGVKLPIEGRRHYSPMADDEESGSNAAFLLEDLHDNFQV